MVGCLAFVCNKFLFNLFLFQDEIESRGAVVFDYTDLLFDPGKLLLSCIYIAFMVG